MSERWEREVRKLGQVAPTPGIWDDATNRTPGPDHGGGGMPPTRQRIIAGIVAFAVFAAAGIFAWQAFRPASGQIADANDDRDWPDLVLKVAETDGRVDATLSFGEVSQGLPVGFEDDRVSPESPWFPTAVPVGTQLRIEEIGDVNVSIEVAGRIMDFGGTEPADRVDEFPQVQGTFSMIYLIDSAGRHGGAGSVIQVLDLDPASTSMLTVRRARTEGPDPTAVWLSPEGLMMGALVPNWGGFRMTVPAGSTVALGGDADHVEFRLSGQEPQVAETSDRDPQPVFSLPSEPGNYDLDVSGIWGQRSVEFTFGVELQDASGEPTTAPGQFDELPPCPAGEIDYVSPASEMPPENVASGETFDTFYVRPDDLSPWSDIDIPEGARLWVVCVEAQPGDLRLLDGDGLVILPSKDFPAVDALDQMLQIDRETTFSPPGNQEPALSAEEALNVFREANPAFTKENLDASLGLYTARSGDGTFRFKDRLAWGYSWKECPPPSPVGPGMEPSGDQDPADSPCIGWLFLDADTGEMLEGLYQQ